MIKFYILDDNHNVVETDMQTWTLWHQDFNRRIVEQTRVSDDVLVSTVFLLGGNHHFFDKGPPLLFETMVFVDGEGGDAWHCATWQEAKEQHAEVVAEEKAKQEAKDE